MIVRPDDRVLNGLEILKSNANFKGQSIFQSAIARPRRNDHVRGGEGLQDFVERNYHRQGRLLLPLGSLDGRPDFIRAEQGPESTSTAGLCQGPASGA